MRDEPTGLPVREDVPVPPAEAVPLTGRALHGGASQDLFQRRSGGGDGERIRIERAGVGDDPGLDRFEDVRPPGDGGDREAPANRLAEHLQVRRDPERLLGPAIELAGRLHLVEDQERPDPIAQLPESLEEPRLRQDEPHVHRNRFEDDCRDILGMLRRPVLGCREVVERSDEGVGVRVRDQTRRRRDDVRTLAAPRLRSGRLHTREKGVVRTVVTSLELQDPGASREMAGEPDREEGRVQSRVRKLDAVHVEPLAQMLA